MKPLYAILGTLIITTAIAGYYGMRTYIVYTTDTTERPAAHRRSYSRHH